MLYEIEEENYAPTKYGLIEAADIVNITYDELTYYNEYSIMEEAYRNLLDEKCEKYSRF